jgi:hypothetical protein
MSKTITREHLALLNAAQHVREVLRKLQPTLPCDAQAAVAHCAAVLTAGLKARASATERRPTTCR